MRIKLRDLGIAPLLLSCPFMYFPKVLQGDTQPWVLIGASLALLSFRTERFLNRRDIVLLGVAFLCVLAYAFRSTIPFFLIRHIYTYLTFMMLWVVGGREKGDYFLVAVKVTVVLWFVVGLYQYTATNLGYQIAISGRFLPGRMGPPSLTAEASYYGSLSVLQLMYLLCQGRGKNGPFIACAVASVALSGSLLAMLLLVFPLWKLPKRLRLAVFIALPLIIVGDFYLTSAGLTSRIQSVIAGGSLSGMFLDASLNLRVGHLYFTMFRNLLPSLMLISPVDFMSQYNDFAADSGLFIPTGTGYILPAVGEMVYASGIVGVLLLAMFIRRAQEGCTTRAAKLEKAAFILACMLNPISISNVFLIIYAQAKEPRTQPSSQFHRHGHSDNMLSTPAGSRAGKAL